MGLFEQRVDNVARESQASPLSNDLIQMLRSQLTGQTGQAFGGMREAGQGIRQFLNSGGANINLPELDLETAVTMPTSADMSGLVGSLENVQNRRVNEQAADLRESFGAAGDRFGTALATGEGRFRRDAEADFEAQLGQLLEGARRFDVNALRQAELGRGQLELGRGQLESERGLTAQQSSINNFLRGLQLQQAFAQNQLAPFLQIGQQGILPEDVVVRDNPWMQLLQAGAGVGAAAAGKPG